jgi:hypothetical protein
MKNGVRHRTCLFGPASSDLFSVLRYGAFQQVSTALTGAALPYSVELELAFLPPE